MVQGCAKMRVRAESAQNITPGHIASIIERCVPPEADAADTVVRLDVAPSV